VRSIPDVPASGAAGVPAVGCGDWLQALVVASNTININGILLFRITLSFDDLAHGGMAA
jgi:hypothetical protein